jgi:type II secretory pathway pseudopilin PulG
MNKKGQTGLGEVPGIVITLGLVAIILGIMATVLVQVQGTQTANSAAYNITSAGIAAQTSLSGWQGTWAVIAAAAVVIGLVAGFLYMRNR